VDEHSRFLDLVQRNPVNVAVLERSRPLPCRTGGWPRRFRSSAGAIDHLPTATLAVEPWLDL
jgi:hypothetical protein